MEELGSEVEWLVGPKSEVSGKSIARKRHADPTLLSLVERRLFVRSVFSYIEAVVFGLKQMALRYPPATDKLSPGEVALANEDDYELDDSGEVKTRPARLSFLSNFRFAFMLADKAWELQYKIDVTGTCWQALRNAVRVRDRLMHPKNADSVVVTDNEVREALRAFEWVARELLVVMARALMSPAARTRAAERKKGSTRK